MEQTCTGQARKQRVTARYRMQQYNGKCQEREQELAEEIDVGGEDIANYIQMKQLTLFNTEMCGEMPNEMLTEMYSELFTEMCSALCTEMYSEMPTEMCSKIINKMCSELPNEMPTEIWSKMINKM